MAKITMLGAGSGFTAGLMRDIMLIPGLKGGEIRLVDIDKARLDITARLIAALAQRINDEQNARWRVVSTTRRRRVLQGSDYIINCIEVSGTRCVARDNDIPARYGVDQCIGDTIGPGGIFKALRTVPSWLKILADIERYCPHALVMNYTNPMSIMTLAAVRSTSARVVGLCHSVQDTTRHLSRIAGVPYEEMVYRCGGINHLAWLTELTHRGKDLYPRIIRRAKRDRTVYELDPVRFEMLFHFGAFITESSGHLSEYVPYFRKRKDLIKKYCGDGYRGASRFYATNWPRWRKQSDRRRRELARDITRLDLRRGVEYASEIIEAHLFDRPAMVYASVLNAGLIPNLPLDGVVEVANAVDGAGPHACRFGKLRPQMAALCDSNMRVFDLVVQGLLHNDRDAVYHAMMLDPLSAAVCSPAEICAMTDDLCRAQKSYIPSFMTRGLSARRKAGPREPVRRRSGRPGGTGPFKA
ncbi:MAG: alpha-glucosidase/alpha-galactosidase [Chitinivibrionales bacterium]|nr:alpha-glucosidase/alpha-galactosidase [Chitinivibrionales bacterium]MBD3395687.1 alpha-glucosidase/alpha-galactosidase [Chitinivibrionales bacterium]